MEKIPENVLEAVKSAAPEGRITCAEAHNLAHRLGVEIIVVGQAADELKIRIKSCRLGCF